MLKRLITFFIAGLLAAFFGIDGLFPFLTGTFFGVALCFCIGKQSKISKGRIWFVTTIWTSLLFFATAFFVLASIPEFFEAQAIPQEAALKVALAIFLTNFIGFAVLRSLLIKKIGLSWFHLQLLVVSLIVAVLVSNILFTKQDFNSLRMAHILWFLIMGTFLTSQKDKLARIIA